MNGLVAGSLCVRENGAGVRRSELGSGETAAGARIPRGGG